MLGCSICGDIIPWLGAEPSVASRWQREAVLLSDPDQEFEQLERYYEGNEWHHKPRPELRVELAIRKDDARSHGYLFGILATEGESLWASWVKPYINAHVHERNGKPYYIPYYITTHGACIAVAEDVMRRSPHDIVVRDLRTLWKVLRMRFQVHDCYPADTPPGTVMPPPQIQLPHNYYIPRRTSPATTGNSFDGRDGIHNSPNGLERWEAFYPLHVPHLTLAILDNLRTMPPGPKDTPETIDFRNKFLTLPTELRDHICSFLVSRNGLPDTCNGFLPQELWLELLLAGKILPFLPEIDADAINDFCLLWDKDHQGSEPNWELLVRRLSQEDWSGGDDTENSSLKVPSGLRNRRRIWRLVEDMYVGDLMPVQRTADPCANPVTLKRYWDYNGRLASPVAQVSVGKDFQLPPFRNV
ncbi:hypothetical protein GGR52DRAFT_558411 [Hypoxylon sp. FL1284]|nr:hypothetical protein GGR52DRAFT_558411 [Hypoxylon sp. FL1284]